MKEKMLKLNFKKLSLILISFILLLGNSLNTYALDTVNITPSQSSAYNSVRYDYVIDKYDVNIQVNENNTLDIKETITAYFNVPKHGIYRIIPLKNEVKRLDDSVSKNRAQISNIKVNEEYKISKSNGNYKIQIGSASKTLTGSHTYVIEYTYNLGKDREKNYDELYYNIIGNEWDTAIGNVSFTINMPKSFDASKLGFSCGSYGSLNSNYIDYQVIGSTITGNLLAILDPYEALTIRLELPDGYFVGTGLNFNYFNYLIIFIPLIFLGISVFFWYKFGRDDKVVETVEFYPPDGFNSLEVGFLYKGSANEIDVTSLLIYLANKGYLKIAETEEKSLFSKSKSFKITKLKEYDGDNANERLFLSGLFKHAKSKSKTLEDNLEEVRASDLYDSFYTTVEKILANTNNKENKNKIFEKKASSKKVFIILMIIATFCLITIPPIIAYGEIFMLPFALLFPGIGFTVMFTMLFSNNQTMYVNGKLTTSNLFVKIFALIWGLGFGGMPWLFVVLPVLLEDYFYLISYIIGIIAILGMVVCLIYLPKRTPYGNEILGKLRGFKNFLETAEKDKLEALVLKDPTYFYNILPYTYVLGVSDKWIKNFETITMQAPVWYDTQAAFDVISFTTFMNTTMTSAQTAMTSSPSSSDSSGGGSSGGGFSGGGSGGGGGGSW